jgi:hypothetical protein
MVTFNLDKFVVGAKIYFYEPPNVQDTKLKGSKAKHLDHYVGPSKVTKRRLEIDPSSYHIGIVIVTKISCTRGRGRNATPEKGKEQWHPG